MSCLYSSRFTGEKIKTINLGSYNYLGFANNDGPAIENVINSIKVNGLAVASTSQEYGMCRLDINIEFVLYTIRMRITCHH
jgi:serine palmitoyltransferase